MSETQVEKSRWSGRAYLRLAAGVGLTVALLAGVAWAVAALRDDGSFTAAAAALAATGLASLVAGVALAFRGGPPQSALNRSLVAMLARLVLVAALAAVCVLVIEVDRGPFLIWLVIAYLALLAVETIFTVRAGK